MSAPERLFVDYEEKYGRRAAVQHCRVLCDSPKVVPGVFKCNSSTGGPCTRMGVRSAHQRLVNFTKCVLQWKRSKLHPPICHEGGANLDLAVCGTILEITGKIQELQSEITCMNDSRDFHDAESVRSGQSLVTSQPVSFPPHPIPGGKLSRSFGMPSRREGPPSIWDTHGISGNVFANPVASSSAPHPQELNPWSSGREETTHSSTVERMRTYTSSRCQSGPSAKSSVITSGRDSLK